MGADGHIFIWKSEVVESKFLDAKKLFYYIPTHYRDTLDGVEYDHVYWGDNLWTDWSDEEDWYLRAQNAPVSSEEDIEPTRERMREFVAWLIEHATHWEVWT